MTALRGRSSGTTQFAEIHANLSHPVAGVRRKQAMSKILASLTAFALLIVLALPAGAAARRSDGVRANDPAAQTEFSARYRGWHRRHFVRRAWWGPRYGYYPRWRPRSAYYPHYRPSWPPW